MGRLLQSSGIRFTLPLEVRFLSTERTNMHQRFGRSTVATAIFLSFVLWSCGAQAQTPDSDRGRAWKTYGNARFAYSVCYPSDVLSPQGESDNGDGQKFTTKDGRAEALVYGAYFARDTEDATLKKAYLDEIQFHKSKGFTIAYKFLKTNQFVISGSQSGKIFYHKTVLVGDVFKTIHLEYSDDVKREFDAIAAKMSFCFHTNPAFKSGP